MSLVHILLCIIIPPVAIFLKLGFGLHFILSVILVIVCWGSAIVTFGVGFFSLIIPIVHAFWVTSKS